jgi:epoxide hydrolase-like predicted phosphatase
VSDTRIEAIVSDFGGVLTTPLIQSFAAFQDQTGITPESLGNAMARMTEQTGKHPLFELECGRMTEEEFLRGLEAEITGTGDQQPHLQRFREIYFDALNPNPPMIGLMEELRDRGLRMAMLTNNVREWEPVWRSMLPVDDIFEFVVDSAFVGCRKPDREIYEIVLERLGLPAEVCLFIDDVEVNIEAAREIGLSAVHFRDNEQAIPEIRGLLDGAPA